MNYLRSILQPNFIEDEDQLAQRWFPYVQNVLLKRPMHNNIKWYVPLENEEILLKRYFNI